MRYLPYDKFFSPAIMHPDIYTTWQSICIRGNLIAVKRIDSVGHIWIYSALFALVIAFHRFNTAECVIHLTCRHG